MKISKQNYIKKRHEYLKAHQEEKAELYKLIETPTEMLMINKHIFPDYLDYTKNSTINKFMNGNEKNSEEVFDEVFDWLMERDCLDRPLITPTIIIQTPSIPLMRNLE